MSDNRYTVVFDGDVREMGKNLFQVVSPFGEVVAIGVGNEFSRADDLAEQVDAYEMDGNSAASEIIRLTAEVKRLRAHVKAAYYEGYGDRHTRGDTDDANDTSGWALSASRAAMGESDE